MIGPGGGRRGAGHIAAMLAAVGLVSEYLGLGSQSQHAVLAQARAEADRHAAHGVGGNRGVKFYKPVWGGYSGDKLARMAAKGALGSSGRFSRSRVYVPGHYGIKTAADAYLRAKVFGHLRNCATEPRS